MRKRREQPTVEFFGSIRISIGDVSPPFLTIAYLAEEEIWLAVSHERGRFPSLIDFKSIKNTKFLQIKELKDEEAFILIDAIKLASKTEYLNPPAILYGFCYAWGLDLKVVGIL